MEILNETRSRLMFLICLTPVHTHSNILSYNGYQEEKDRKTLRLVENITFFFYLSRPVQSWNILPHVYVNRNRSSFCMLLKPIQKGNLFSFHRCRPTI